MNLSQLERIEKINELIKVIGDTDRKFFNYNGCYSRFVVQGKKLFYIDKYTEKRIYPYQSSKHIGFSDGGTLWALINDFREWIIKGKRSNGNNGYGGLYCTSWGYSIAGMDKVISKAKEIGYLNNTDPTFRMMCEKIKANGNEWYLSHSLRKDLDC
ncbi:hypothetical protein [Alkaliphilus sp. B6464]|uniref:hypothetical protein n=1 Tax=Alkaliphilus sp. B6464 TaxID=2731219 RepID=UPI001BA8F7DB|nr:hypothetical protein [Alkaliphilus sp. B6464]QUH21917.1 hypothetical protein HYG84_18450 [Alkaliphilus sp. B6464]